MPAWLRMAPDTVTIALHIQPGAKKTEIVGTHGDALKIRLAAPPVEGKANAALTAFIAERLGVPKARVRLKSGHSNRRKLVEVEAPPPDVEQRLGGLASSQRPDQAAV